MLEQDRKQMLAEIGLFCVAAGVGAFVWAFQTGESPTGRYGEAESAGCVLAQLVLTGVCFFWINKVGKVGGDQPAWEQALASARVNYMIPLACYSGFLGGYWATSVGVGTLIGSVVALFLTGLLWRAFDDSKAESRVLWGLAGAGYLLVGGWILLSVPSIPGSDIWVPLVALIYLSQGLGWLDLFLKIKTDASASVRSATMMRAIGFIGFSLLLQAVWCFWSIIKGVIDVSGDGSIAIIDEAFVGPWSLLTALLFVAGGQGLMKARQHLVPKECEA